MSQPLTITECLLDQCRRYPALEPQDLIKALHQSVYGCGHLVGAAEEGVGRIREEMESARGDAAGAEMLAGAYCRLPLAWARKLGGPASLDGGGRGAGGAGLPAGGLSALPPYPGISSGL